MFLNRSTETGELLSQLPVCGGSFGGMVVDISIKAIELGMVVHIYNPSTWASRERHGKHYQDNFCPRGQLTSTGLWVLA
jgi:hypothetical protein